MRKLRSRLTFANVCSFLALVIAIGTGGAYAANTVFSSDIVDGEVKTLDIGQNQVRAGDVRDKTLAGGGLQGVDIQSDSLSGAHIINGSVGSSEIEDGSIGFEQLGSDAVTSTEVANGSLNDEDIAQGTFVNFTGSIGNVPAQNCVERQVTGVNAAGDHLVLTPNFNSQEPALIYSAEYTGGESMDIQVCNPTGSAINDGNTQFNLLVIDAQ